MSPITYSAATPVAPAGYEILGELGRGGMGVVYRARQLDLNREVALKMVLAGGHASSAALARFAAEAEAVARLDHPNVVRVLHAGHHAGLPFFAMELVGGGNVADAVKSGALDPREAARLVEQVARGVGYCHDRGVLHRDLKPGNLLLTPDGIPKVTDFGLARLTDSENDLTATGAVLGTPGYMAPEQAAGNLEGLGPHTDVYGLGAVLYCLLTGRPPFGGVAVQLVLAQVQSVDPVTPSRLAAGVPLDLETICLKCLAKEPSRRYPTADALADDLGRWLSGRPIAARPAGLIERARKGVKRNRGLTFAVATVFLTVVAGAGVATWQAVRASEEAVRAADNARTADANAKTADANARSADSNAERADANARAARIAEGVAVGQARLAWDRLYVSDMRLAHRAWLEARPDRLRTLLDAHRPDHADGVERRNFEWRHLDRALHNGFRAFDFPGERPNGVAYHPNGSRVVAVGRSGIKVWDLQSGKRLETWPSKSPFTSGVAFSPDGTLLAVGGEDGMTRVLDAATGRELHVLKGHSGAVMSVAFSPNGTRLATGSRDQTVRIWDIKMSKSLWLLSGPGRTVGCVAFSIDGTTVAAGEGERLPPAMGLCRIYLWDAATGQSSGILAGHTDTVGGVAFDPGNGRLVSASWDGSIRIWDPSGKQAPAIMHSSPDRLMTLAFSPDGTRLAVAGVDRQVRLWNPRTAQLIGSLRGHAGGILAMAFGRDGLTLATCGGRVFADTADGEVLTWDLRVGQDPLALPAGTGPVLGVAFGPGGELAAGGWNGGVTIWEGDYSRRAARPTGHPGRVESVAFDADGSKLASCGSDRMVRVWNARTGLPIFSRLGSENIYAVTFSPDGRHVAAVAAGRKLRMWDADTGQEKAVIGDHGYQARGLGFSPDGSKLATGSAERVDGKGVVKVWDVATGKELANLVGHGGNVTSVAFGPGGARLATAASDGTVRVWNMATGREVLVLRGHAGRVAGVSLSPDGTRVASAGWDGTVRVWDAETGQELLTLDRGLGSVPGEDASANQASSVAFSRDGTRLAAGFWDGSVRVWHAASTDSIPREPKRR